MPIRFMTGEEYINAPSNADLKAAHVDAFQHFVKNVSPVGELREGRVITIDIAELPSDWNWEEYLAANKSLRDAGLDTQEEAEWHYLNYGYYEHRSLHLIPPDGWDAAFYLAKYKDVMDDSYYGSWPLAHYIDYGKAEGRIYRDGWEPPTTKGMHEIVTRVGEFGMSVAKDGKKISIGLYREYGGIAKFFEFDGTLKEIPELALQIESHYMITIRPDGLRLVTTECPAQAIKEQPDHSWKITRLRTESDSCAFEQIEQGNELVIMTVDRAYGSNIVLFKGDINGNNFQPWKTITGRYLNYGISNSGIRVCGSTGQTANDTPIIANENGGDIRNQPDYADQQYSYTVGKDGKWALGAQSITEADGFRRAYIDLFDGTNLRSVYSFKPPYDPPWTMDMQIHPITGDWWCVASAWAEPGRCQPVLVISRDKGQSWARECSIPMTACIAMFFADDGVYLIGGEKGKKMVLCFYRP